MSRLNESGLTLVEIIIAVAITAMIGTAAAALLSVSLNAQQQCTSKSQVYSDGLQVMERMTGMVRSCTFLCCSKFR